MSPLCTGETPDLLPAISERLYDTVKNVNDGVKLFLLYFY
jgi:hypothetical protein